MLLARGTPLKAEILYTGLSCDAVRRLERRLIAEHRQFPWNCSTADNGEGISARDKYNVYALREPWENGRMFLKCLSFVSNDLRKALEAVRCHQLRSPTVERHKTSSGDCDC
jgi:hypothetical protein